MSMPTEFEIELHTLLTPGSEEFFGAVGDVLARHDAAMPVRLGPEDPPRTKVEDLPTQLRALGLSQAGEYSARVLVQYEPEAYGQVRYQRDPFAAAPKERAVASGVDLLVVDSTAAQAILVELAEDLQPFYARLSPLQHVVQSRSLTSRWGKAVGPAPDGSQPPRWEPAPFGTMERHVPDVFWVQVFGPAYVAKWGEHRVVQAGVRRERLSNGGYVVWACDEPPPFQDDATQPQDYAWKSSLYDAIGRRPFAASSPGWSLFGEQVPFMTEHRDALP